jgi:pimeloyl-ACP methyl ester carboxylesterase
VTLAERIVALHEALNARRIPHAFGGAIALAYATQEPRGTRDIDLNIFVPVAEADAVLDALPRGIEAPGDAAATIRRDGQVRLFWDDTPIDLFFNYAPIHDEAARHRRSVPFEGTRIPVLGPIELAVFKAMFSRGRDWGDLEEMADAGTLDRKAVRANLVDLVGEDDERVARLDELARPAGS